MDEMKHDAQEKDSRMESAETETGGDLTESGGKLPLESSDATSEEHDAETQVNGDNGEEGESVSLRFRKPDTRLRIAGIALAVFVLLVALLIVCMAAGRKNESGGSSDTTESPGAPEESTEGGTGSPEIVDLYRFDPSEIPEGHIGFRPKDLSGEIGTLTNQTALSPDLAALLARFGESGAEAETPAVFSDPLVLILHTHTTEGYAPTGAISWDGNGEFSRSERKTENVIAIGRALADALNGLGIPTLHCEIYHDTAENGTDTYAGSYARSAETVEHYKALYPSIRYVIDLHRDAVFDENGNALRAVTAVDGKAVAQVMAVVGVGEGDAWEGNLALALAVMKELNGKEPSLSRTPTLKGSPLNGELSDYALTLEIGTAANTLEEAKLAAEYTATALAAVIRRVEGE